MSLGPQVGPQLSPLTILTLPGLIGTVQEGESHPLYSTYKPIPPFNLTIHGEQQGIVSPRKTEGSCPDSHTREDENPEW